MQCWSQTPAYFSSSVSTHDAQNGSCVYAQLPMKDCVARKYDGTNCETPGMELLNERVCAKRLSTAITTEKEIDTDLCAVWRCNAATADEVHECEYGGAANTEKYIPCDYSVSQSSSTAYIYVHCRT